MLPQDHNLNYLWLRYLQSKSFCDTTTQLEMEKYMSKPVKHNYPKEASHHNYRQKKKDYYMNCHISLTEVGVRYANVPNNDHKPYNHPMGQC